MRRASKFAIISLVSLPVFGLLVFPTLYRIVDNYIVYLTGYSQFQLRAIGLDDFDDFEPDLTASSFHKVTKDELARFPPLNEGIEYFEGKRDNSTLSNARVFCDIYPDCVVWIQVKNTEWQSFWDTFEFDQCYSVIEFNQRYYGIGCIPGPDFIVRSEYLYGFWIMIAGIPVLVIVWLFHKWHAEGKTRSAAKI